MADIIPTSMIYLLGNKSLNLTSDTIVATLHTAGANFSINSENYNDTYELPTQNGYTRLNNQITNANLYTSGVYVIFDFDNVQWSASGGDIGPIRYCAFVDIENGINKYIYIIDYMENKTINDGIDFTQIINVSGLFKMYQLN